MRKNTYLLVIGLIFLCMFYLGHQPFLATVLSKEELIISAISNSFGSKGCSLNGSLSVKVNNPYINEDLELFLDGYLNKDKRKIKIFKDDIQFNYYEDLDIICITTPFKSINKLLVNKSEKSNNDINISLLINKILEESNIINIEKNVPVNINQKGFYEVKILTNCYTIKIEPKFFDILKEQFKKDLKKVNDINIKLFVDEELQIRLVEIETVIQDAELQIKICFDKLIKENKIKIPDISDAKVLNGSIEEIILQLLESN